MMAMDALTHGMRKALLTIENEIRVYFDGIVEEAQEGEIIYAGHPGEEFPERFQHYCAAGELEERMLAGVMRIIREALSDQTLPEIVEFDFSHSPACNCFVCRKRRAATP